MDQSGKKLVFVLAGLALAAGVTSWCYRYEAAHQATAFWGTESAPLIAQPAPVEIYELKLLGGEGASEKEAGLLNLGRRYQVGDPRELTNARGMVHLRHALMSDSNFRWEMPAESEKTDWRWCLRFYDAKHEVRVVLSADLATIGRMTTGEPFPIEAFSCRPMTESLQVYFEDLGLISASTVE